MVRANAVKDKTVAKVSKVSAPAGRPTEQLVCSPSTRSNAAKKSGNSILDKGEQKSYKEWISERNQIQGLIICCCGLGIQEAPTMPQKMQVDSFQKEFSLYYLKLCKDPILGKRATKIPEKYLTVSSSRASETTSGEKMRKKYSSMKTYMNNTLSPIFSRYDFNVNKFALS